MEDNVNSEVRDPQGLTSAEVTESRRLYGENVLTPAPRISKWKVFLKNLADPMIRILIVAGFLSIGISFYNYYGLGHDASTFFEPSGIFIAILLAAGLSFLFEQKAEREFALLNLVNDDNPVEVIRDGNITEVTRKEIVKGDIVILNTGDEIPADGKLISCTSLNVDESSLTGEPMTMKTTDPDSFDKEATFPSNFVYRGTKVMEGHGIMEVSAVGDATENGKVFKSVELDNGVETPLNRQLGRLGKVISIISYIVGAIIIVARVAMYLATMPFELMPFLSYLLETVMLAVTLIVVAVPEGLPMAVTLSLAYSMRKMLRNNNLVRKLHACETMGATTVICTDKTGTLTKNRMEIAEIWLPGTEEKKISADKFFIYNVACNSTANIDFSKEGDMKVIGNPTEGALLLWLNAKGVDYREMRRLHKPIAELPFSTERKYMATVIEGENGKDILLVKGAPEIVVGLCKHLPDGVSKENVLEKLHAFQSHGMRTLALAYKIVMSGEKSFEEGKLIEGDLELSGIVSISDPVREDVPQAVGECLRAGIAVKVVTGDTPLTAKEIGRQIGLWKESDGNECIVTGRDIEKMDDEELRKRIGDIKIVARARPMDKRRLVNALQENGEVVAVTGDGTNDAPALKAADVGLSMGDGTSVAKEAGDITILDNSFASIGKAVMWGRSLYKNIQRFILFQLTVNLIASLVVLAGSFMGLESPITITQMLWVNLVMDTVAAVAFASLPPSPDVMKDKPRHHKDFIITKPMWHRIVLCGVLFFAILGGVLYYFEHTSLNSLLEFGKTSLENANCGLTPYKLTVFFTLFILLNYWNIFNAKSFGSENGRFSFKGCKEFFIIVGCILLGQILVVTFGGGFFNVIPLDLTDWTILILATLPVALIGQAFRIIALQFRKNR